MIYKLSMTIEEIQQISYYLNPEITNLLHEEIWTDEFLRTIECTQQAMEKIMYYLEPGFLKDRLQAQIDEQESNDKIFIGISLKR